MVLAADTALAHRMAQQRGEAEGGGMAVDVFRGEGIAPVGKQGRVEDGDA